MVKKKSQRLSFTVSQIFFLIGDEKKKLPLFVIIFLISSLIDLLGLSLIGPYVSIATGSEIFLKQLSFFPFENLSKEKILIYLGIILVTIFLLKAIISISINYLILLYVNKIQVTLKSFLMKSYQSFSYERFIDRKSSEFIYNINNLSTSFSDGVIFSILKMFSDVTIALVILSYLAFENLKAFLLFSILILITIILYDKLFRSTLPQYGRLANNASTNMIQGIQQSLDGFKEIRVLGVEKFFYEYTISEVKKSVMYNRYFHLISTSPRYILEFVMVLFVFILVLIMVIFESQDEALIPTITVFGFAGIRLIPSANIVSNSIGQLRFNKDSISRLYNDIKEIEKDDNTDKTVFQNHKNINFRNLTLEKVSFKYPKSREFILKDVSFEIKRGECIGIIGPSGSGKSTILNIILGLFEPSSGKLLINSKPVKNILKSWRSCVAYLPQEIFLIDNTIAKNVALGSKNSEINTSAINSALKSARLFDYVENLPEKTNTVLGERGVKLSGGQKQRIAIARSFYYKREVLVLDEATSSVDNETERKIVNEIQRLKGLKTMIIIAHRLSTLSSCDRIYEIKNGSIEKWMDYKTMIQRKV